MNILQLGELLSLDFVQRSLIVGFILSLSTALLGSVLVYKRLSLIGDGLAHIGFGAVSLAVALSWAPLYLTIPTMVVAAIIIVLLNERQGIYSDALIGIISNASLAFGIIVATKSKGFSVDIAGYLFGSILTLTHSDVKASILLGSIVIISTLLLHNRLFLITHDEEYAKTRGINTRLYKIIIAILTGITVAIGMRLTGSLLISSLIIFPVTIANHIAKSYRSLVVFSMVIAVITFYSGIILSILLEIPSGASIIMFNLFILSIVHIVKRKKFS
ncbi:metal ABC transporter permease [Entomospira nematocerorum]|uniref:Metal ABC transporter permease n=1 Tax=Entomospira nematocerorum TaxID=2719987 RepID=A0A968GBU9_9SPIO|nr:metal ABC transporter permease [Entomospira nematocera]NIZ46919.1 metal ABC transporter permease [Entomospira nematocera]WDI33283.1 metal ABC transporter permease [Entomospira nematocera]